MNTAELTERIRSNWRRKAVLSLVLTAGTWTGYLLIQRCTPFPVTAMPVLSVDRIIPFVPDAVYLYESLWLLMPVAPWLMKTREELGRYTWGLALISGLAFSIFFFFPTSSPRPVDGQDLNALYRALIRIDNELNAFPSLHSAFAVFHASHCHRIFSVGRCDQPIRWLFWLWATAIIAATLLTKQHVIVDAIAGALLGFGGCATYRFPIRVSAIEGRRT